MVGLSHLDVPHQAAPGAGIQDVDNGGHEVVDVNRLGVIRGAQLWEEQGMSEPPRPPAQTFPCSSELSPQHKVVVRQLCPHVLLSPHPQGFCHFTSSVSLQLLTSSSLLLVNLILMA